MSIAKSGWYKLTFNAVIYFIKDAAGKELVGGMERVVIDGHEGARYEGINTGYTEDITVEVYNTTDDFAAIENSIKTPAVGDLASASWKTCTLTRLGGTGIASVTSTKCLAKTVGTKYKNKDGHHAACVFEFYQTAPATS